MNSCGYRLNFCILQLGGAFFLFRVNCQCQRSSTTSKRCCSEKAKKKEEVPEREGIKHLFDVLCTTEDQRDYEDFEIDDTKDDDAVGSVVSSTMGAEDADDDRSIMDGLDETEFTKADWEILNESEKDETIDSRLRRIGNLKKKPMSTFILTDLLGEDADAKMVSVAKSHRKRMQAKQLYVNDVYRAIMYFNSKLEKRCCRKFK